MWVTLFVWLLAIAAYRFTGTATGVVPYIGICLYWYTFVTPQKMVVVLTFGLIIALCTSVMVKLTTGAVVMAQGALTSKKEDQHKIADSLNDPANQTKEKLGTETVEAAKDTTIG